MNTLNNQICDALRGCGGSQEMLLYGVGQPEMILNHEPHTTPSIMQQPFERARCERDLFMLMAGAGLIVFS